jgi:hypothetical protein
MESILSYRRKLLNFPKENKQYVVQTIPRYQGTPGLEIVGPNNEHAYCRKCRQAFHVTSGTIRVKKNPIEIFKKLILMMLFVIGMSYMLFLK